MSPPLFLLPALLLAASAVPAEFSCPTKCGDVDIPYPFGIGASCSRSKGFELACIENGSKTAVLKAASMMIPVMSLTVMPQPEAKVMLPVAHQCYNSSGYPTGLPFDGQVDFNTHGVWRISNARNMFVVLGCNTLAYTKNSNSKGKGRYDYVYYTGCVAYCNDSQSAQNGQCVGVGCCHVDIAPGLADNAVTFQAWEHKDMAFSPCDYAFLVGKQDYRFHVSDLHMDVNRTTMPVWLDWAIRDDGGGLSCTAAKNRTGYACISANSECVDSVNGPGYFCRCKPGYEGNPYQAENGCTNIDECTRPEEFPCYGVCKDMDGSYNCKCPRGYKPNGDPKKERCSPKFPFEAQLAIGGADSGGRVPLLSRRGAEPRRTEAVLQQGCLRLPPLRSSFRVRPPPPRSDGGGGGEPTATSWVSPNWLTSLSRRLGQGGDDSGIPVATAKLDDVRDLLGGALFLPLFKWFREDGPVYRLAAGPRDFVVVSDPAVAKQVLCGYGSRYEKGLVAKVAEVSEFLFGSGFATAEGAL